MPYSHNFIVTPFVRYGANPGHWTRLLIHEHADQATAPDPTSPGWATVDDIAIAVPGTPAAPGQVLATTYLALLQEGWYAGSFVDADGVESEMTAPEHRPVSDLDSYGWAPNHDQVALLLRTMTKVDDAGDPDVLPLTGGNEAGEFIDGHTRPGRTQVENVIAIAVADVAGEVTGDMPASLHGAASSASLYLAAMLVLFNLPEDTDVLYERLERLYDGKIAELRERWDELDEDGDEDGDGIPDRPLAIGVFPAAPCDELAVPRDPRRWWPR